MRTIEVIQVGSPVTIGIDHDIPAVVTGVMVAEHEHITYECAWWDGRIRQSEWLESIEVLRVDATSGRGITQAVRVGFHNGAAKG